jgi:hypothetical protein
LLPSDTTRATTPVNISTNSGKPPFCFFLKRCANSTRWDPGIMITTPCAFFLLFNFKYPCVLVSFITQQGGEIKFYKIG